jgi:formamidopyrimidine-DNA glycosylase
LATLGRVPELPEVESFRLLAERAVGRTVASMVATDAWFLKGGIDAAGLGRALIGHRFTEARRIGKLLLLDVDSGPTLGIRFGMTGSLVVDDRAGVSQLLYTPTRHDPAWDRWSVAFEDGGSLVVRDPRRLGGVSLDPDLTRLGPDAATISRAEMAAALRGSKTALKARLLDQARVAGVGNLLADEALWRAGLSPLHPAGSLSPAELRRLHRHLVGTIEELTTRGGSHRGDLMDERRPGGRCPRDGAELVRATVGGRTSWWCPVHQV